MTVSVLFRGVHIGKTTGKPTKGARFISPIGHRMYGFFLGYQDSQPYPIGSMGLVYENPSFDEFSCFSCRYVLKIIEAASIVDIAIPLFSSFCWVIFDAWKQLMIRVKKKSQKKTSFGNAGYHDASNTPWSTTRAYATWSQKKGTNKKYGHVTSWPDPP